jgi:hypothetical protein
MLNAYLGANREGETTMSRISEDDRTASQEVATVVKWTIVLIVIIGVIGVGTLIWAGTGLLHSF